MACTGGCPQFDEAGHTWVRDHETYSGSCEHCKYYCTRAAVQMMNRFYKGTITQDEVSYHCRAEFGPKNDLGHGKFLRPMGASTPLAWALNVDAADIRSEKGTWTAVANSVASYRPVLVSIPNVPVPPGGDITSHACVVCGVRVRNGNKEVRLCDPAKTGARWERWAPLHVTDLQILPRQSIEALEGNELIREGTNSDSDWLIDFDELNRFQHLGLNIKKEDSDNDGVHDHGEVWIWAHQ